MTEPIDIECSEGRILQMGTARLYEFLYGWHGGNNTDRKVRLTCGDHYYKATIVSTQPPILQVDPTRWLLHGRPNRPQTRAIYRAGARGGYLEWIKVCAVHDRPINVYVENRNHKRSDLITFDLTVSSSDTYSARMDFAIPAGYAITTDAPPHIPITCRAVDY